MGDQGAASGLHRRGQVEHPVGEAVIRAGGGGNGRQQILAVGIVHRGSALLDLGGAVQLVVGVVGAGAGRLAGSLGPVQNACLGVIAIGGGLAQCIRDAGDLVPVSRIYRAGGNGLAAAAQLYGLDVAIGIIGEPGGNALRPSPP